jgi:tRNA threonylcarbamoyladenosine biosynthesis protein TsaE
MKILSQSVGETNRVARDFLKKVSRIKTDRAVVVGLFGDLGSGKTTFTQAIGKHLVVKEVITSPTFVIEKIYRLDGKNNFKNLIHIDAYRLDSEKELASLGFKEISQDSGNLILIEWPERVADILPTDLIKINFKFISEFEREIKI